MFVYRNLHNGLWSLRACDGPDKGRVLAHVPRVALADCRLRVQEGGRQRVLREQRKNVHAGIQGRVLKWGQFVPDPPAQAQALFYNPYRSECFRMGEAGPCAFSAPLVIFDEKRPWAIPPSGGEPLGLHSKLLQLEEESRINGWSSLTLDERQYMRRLRRSNVSSPIRQQKMHVRRCDVRRQLVLGSGTEPDHRRLVQEARPDHGRQEGRRELVEQGDHHAVDRAAAADHRVLRVRAADVRAADGGPAGAPAAARTRARAVRFQ